MASTGKARKPMKAWERYFKREVGALGPVQGSPGRLRKGSSKGTLEGLSWHENSNGFYGCFLHIFPMLLAGGTQSRNTHKNGMSLTK